MNRRNFLFNSALVGAGSLMPLHLFSKDTFRRDFASIRRNVGVYTERGGTIGWLINDNAVVAIDSQYPESAANCIAGLKKRTSRHMDYLINTHHHGDHT